MRNYYSGNLIDAYNILINNNPLFFLCGELCDHFIFCGKECLHKRIDGNRFKFELIEKELLNKFGIKYNFPKVSKNKILVIGAGPSGLMASILLRKSGFNVTVIEKENSIGGAIKSFIPSFRFDKSILNSLENALSNYINFIYNKEVLDVTEFENDYDFIICSTGTQISFSNLINENVFTGHFILSQINQGKCNIKNKKIGILGLGNVAIDCARSLKRLGNDVKIIYRRTIDNSLSSIEELEIIDNEEIKVEELLSCISFNSSIAKFQKMKLSDEVINGRRSFIKLDEYKEEYFDYLIEAYGSRPNFDIYNNIPHFDDFINKGYLRCKTIGKYYFLGDLFDGASTIVQALSGTKEEILKLINNIESINKIKNQPIIFGGSFNPITLAHVQIYYYLKNISNDVRLLPNGNSYPTKELLSYDDRCSLIRLMLPNAEILNYEVNKEFKGTYQFLRDYNHPLFSIGSDGLVNITKWINYELLIKENNFIIFSRSNDNVEEIIRKSELLNKYKDHFHILNVDILDISSTSFRNKLEETIVGKTVYDEIINKKFYN